MIDPGWSLLHNYSLVMMLSVQDQHADEQGDLAWSGSPRDAVLARLRRPIRILS
jgi:hypothetical protein